MSVSRGGDATPAAEKGPGGEEGGWREDVEEAMGNGEVDA